MTRRFTLALRVCLNCQRTFGLALWPWSGAHWKRTHGLCQPCHKRLAAAIDYERPVDRSPTVGAHLPAA